MEKIVIEGYENIQNIHFIGIGGVSMSGIAQMLVKSGYNVTGTDRAESEQTQMLVKAGIEVKIGSHIDMLKDVDLVIYTVSVKETNPEIVEAKRLNIPILERAKILGMITKQFTKSVAISGTHGKTTTTSFISNIFLEAKTDLTIQVGAFLNQINGNYRIGDSDYFIFESCEYNDSFLNFYPNTEVILNIDEDHLDYFKTFENIKRSFKKSTDNISENGFLVINTEDENADEVIKYVENQNKLLNKNVRIIKILGEDADYTISNLHYKNGFPAFTINEKESKNILDVHLKVPGKYNAKNAIAAYAVAKIYGIDESDILKGLESFTGAHRRFEYKGEYKGAKVYDDYAHHPTEIQELAKAVSKMGYNRVVAVFEPHTYSRTINLKNEFVQALSNFDEIIIAKIYAAREIDTSEISGNDIANELKKLGKDAKYIEEYEDIVKYLKSEDQTNNIIITIGAGTITNLGKMLID